MKPFNIEFEATAWCDCHAVGDCCVLVQNDRCKAHYRCRRDVQGWRSGVLLLNGGERVNDFKENVLDWLKVFLALAIFFGFLHLLGALDLMLN